MKLLVLFVLSCLQIQYITGSNALMEIDPLLVKCIPHNAPVPETQEEYGRIQIVTDLIHRPLRDIAKRNVTVETNGEYNRFLTCSWIIYQYQSKRGDIIFNTIERVLGDALVREVGGTGPGANLSRMQAKQIVENCKDKGGITPGSKVVRVQNCILQQINYLDNL